MCSSLPWNGVHGVAAGFETTALARCTDSIAAFAAQIRESKLREGAPRQVVATVVEHQHICSHSKRFMPAAFAMRIHDHRHTGKAPRHFERPVTSRCPFTS